MHWSLDQVRDLTVEEFDELVAWAKKRAEKSAGGDEDSVDMDAVIDASKKAKERKANE